MTEIFKPIPNFEDYQVGSLGSVKSVKFKKERILKPNLGVSGYLSVDLCKDGIVKTMTVHKLVAMAFLGHKPDGTQKIVVDHINNIKNDNRVENLQLTTQRNNASKDRNANKKYTGVYWRKESNKWSARIGFGNRLICLGNFTTEDGAYGAYLKALNYANQGLNLNAIYPLKQLKRNSFG
jgi:hypothetical protein